MPLYDDEENVLIIDNGCDQSIITLTSFLVNTYTGIFIHLNGAMNSMKGSKLEIVNDAYNLAEFDNGSKCLLKTNQCLYDPDPLAYKSLLQPHQARHHVILVDDCAKLKLSANGSHGEQCM